MALLNSEAVEKEEKNTDFVVLDVLNPLSGEKEGEIHVNENFFDKPNKHVLWYYVKWYLASQRAGTHDTKTRSDVRGGGRKPWPQKHTGRARQGSIRNPHWVGGAVAHGPHPRDYSYKMNKKEKREAMRSAISEKFHEKKLKIISEIALEQPKTKKALEIIRNIDAYPLTLITSSPKKNVFLSFRNIPLTDVIPVDEVNPYYILLRDFVVFEKQAILKILQRYGVEVIEK